MTKQVVRVGLIERGGPTKGYRWVEGYAFADEHVVEYPWLTFREIQKEAKKRNIPMPRAGHLIPERE